jgi:hypothetical protein
MCSSRNVGVALIGLLVVAAISVAAGSGRKPAALNAAASKRMLTQDEAAQIGKRFPGLWVRSQVRSELLDRLFPSAAFYMALRRGGTPRFPYMISISGNRVFEMPSGFNLLLRDQGVRVMDDNVVDLAMAFVILAVGSEPIVDTITGAYVGIESIPQVTFLGGKRIKQRDLRYPYAVDAKIVCRVGSGETQTWDFSQGRDRTSKGVRVKVGQFGAVRVSVGGKPLREYLPVTAKEETRTGAASGAEWIEIDTAIGNVTVEHESLRSHYYLKTSRNGVPTDHFVGFRLHEFGENRVFRGHHT